MINDDNRIEWWNSAFLPNILSTQKHTNQIIHYLLSIVECRRNEREKHLKIT